MPGGDDDADPVAVNRRVAMMCLCCYMFTMLCHYAGGNDVYVLHVYNVDADSVHHQVEMMCKCCLFTMLMPSCRWQ